MRAGLRPYAKAGVALVGVSVIALAPIAAAPPDVKIANPDVHLSANPLEEYLAAFQRAIESAQLVLEQLFAEPTPISEEWVLNSLVTDLLDDPDANRREFAAALGETPTSLNAYLEIVEALPGRLETAADLIAVGNIQGAADTLLSLTTSVVVHALLSPVGAVNSGLSAGADAAQEVLAALKSGDPRRVLGAIIAAPAIVADGILHGHAGFTGLLDPGGPVGINKAPTGERLLTLEPKAGLGLLKSPMPPGGAAFHGEEKQPPSVPREVKGADEGTNVGVMATDGDNDVSAGQEHRPRALGVNSDGRGVGAAGLNTLHNGIRDGIRGFREGVRDAVKTLTGRGDGAAATSGEQTAGSPSQ